MIDPKLSPGLVDSALRLAGTRPENLLCPVCGCVVADELLSGDRPPVHQHHRRTVELIPRADL